MNGVVRGRIIMSGVVWRRGGAGRQGTKVFAPPPPSKFIGGGSWPPLPTLMHTEIKIQITANTCIWELCHFWF